MTLITFQSYKWSSFKNYNTIITIKGWFRNLGSNCERTLRASSCFIYGSKTLQSFSFEYECWKCLVSEQIHSPHLRHAFCL